MKQKIQISEATLKRIITKALNEAINKEQDLIDWAYAVAQGGDPLYCKEFSRFYGVIIREYRCTNAIKSGIAKENASQTGYSDSRSKYSILVDELFSTSSVEQDVLQDFFSGVNYAKKDSSKDDSFLGSVDTCVGLLLRNNVREFFAFLCRLLTTYASHYYRYHYKEWVMQYGKGATQIGGDKSSAIEDDYTGNYVAMDNNDKLEYDITSLKGGNDNDYTNKLLSFAEEIVNDKTVRVLSPQEKDILNCLIDIIRNPTDPDLFDKRLTMSPQQQRNSVYNEIAKKIGGIDGQTVGKRLSTISKKVQASKYAQMVKENKNNIRQKIINEVMRRILSEKW